MKVGTGFSWLRMVSIGLDFFLKKVDEPLGSDLGI